MVKAMAGVWIWYFVEEFFLIFEPPQRREIKTESPREVRVTNLKIILVPDFCLLKPEIARFFIGFRIELLVWNDALMATRLDLTF